MTELLERAMARIRELPPEEQDEATEQRIGFAGRLSEPVALGVESPAA